MWIPDLDEINVALARKSLIEFTTYTMPEYQVNWHHRLMCDYLDKFARLEIKRLMIFCPPRMGKSELVSRRLPAFILGNNPNAPIISASYGADLARRMNRDVQRIIDGPEYRRVFPDTKLFGKNIRTVGGGSWLRNSDEFEIVEYSGYYRGAGVGGAITGMGMKYGIIDDPVKNRQDASSAVVRQGLWDWYVSTFRTRLAPGGGILITVTTWHEDGLEARLLRLAESSATADQWTVIRLPAIAEEPIPVYDIRQIGEPLWPERYSLTEMEATKVTLGSYEWNALYQQRPSPDAGGILKRHWWRYWKPRGANLPPVLVKGEDGELVEIEAVELPSKFDEQLQSWDLTFKDTKGSDFVAGQVFGRKGANKYMLDYYKERADIGSTMEQIVKYTNKWPDATAKLIEDKANGPAVIQMLRHKVTGLIAVEPQGGKISRAHAAAPEVESGNVYLPHPALYPWVSDFIDSCAGFPNMANDDDVDAFTQAMIRMASKRTIDDFNIGSMTGTSKWRL
jgi:predicted phage terminase large subunit-like protein